MAMAAAPCVLNVLRQVQWMEGVEEGRGHTWGGPQVIGFPAPSIPPPQELWAPDEWRSAVVTQGWLERRHTLLARSGLNVW